MKRTNAAPKPFDNPLLVLYRRLARKQELTLLDHVQPIRPLRRDETYAWISPDELLIVRPELPSFSLYPLKRAQQQDVFCTLHSFSVSTGIEHPLTVFNQQHSLQLLANRHLMRFRGDFKWSEAVHYHAPQIHLSPNGRYLLWQGRNDIEDITKYGWHLTDLSGSLSTTLLNFVQPGSPVYWLPDSRTWLEIHREKFLVRQLNEPETVQETSVMQWQDGLLCGITAHGSLMMHHPVFPKTSEDYWKSLRSTHTQFSETKLGDKQCIARHFKIRLPKPGKVTHIPLSPNGQRIAWLIQHVEAGNLENAIFSFWTSDLLGKNVNAIGQMMGPTKVDEDSPSGKCFLFPHDLQWSPDGQWLSFANGEDLYRIPAH